jgi:transcriptional regulator with XRE-family HTH domain
MADIYEAALKRLRTDKRTHNELERVVGLPAETIRDIRNGITTNPRFDTMRRLAKWLQRAA